MRTLAKVATLLPSTMPVSLERDPWDWVLYAASLSAAIAAVILFLPWALERRRRPEVKIEWALSLDGDPANLTDWNANDAPKVTPGQVICVRVAFHNVGDRATEAALTNFVAAADYFDLRNNYRPEQNPAFSGDLTAGLPPDHQVIYLPIWLPPWTPGNTLIHLYQLTYKSSSAPDQELRTRLLFSIADSRFNRTGRRWLPSALPPLYLNHASAGKPWPPESKRQWPQWVKPQWVKPDPKERIACSRGNRRDVRDLTLLPSQQALAPPVKNRHGLLDYRRLARLIKRA
jgi:hypothetical protein